MPDYRANFKIRGTPNGRALLDAQQVREIRARARDGEQQVDLADEYGVTKHTISYIGQHRSWAGLSDEPGGPVPADEQVALAALPEALNDAEARKRGREACYNARVEALTAKALGETMVERTEASHEPRAVGGAASRRLLRR